jgi:hypothetical protein
MLLSGPAALWWEGLRLPDATHIDVFVDKFREAFRPRNFVESVRAELLDIRMKGTLAEYITRFRRLIAVLMPEGEHGADRSLEELGRTVFLKGLTPVLHRMIFANVNMATASIEEVINSAEYYLHFVQGDASGSAVISAPPRHNANDMELDNIAVPGLDSHAIQVVVNAIMQAQQQQRNQYYPNNNQRGSRPNGNQHQWGRNNNTNNNNNSNNNNDWAHLPRLTPAERQYLIENGGCFKCRKLGHLSYENRCPPRNRGMNHIATNVGAPFHGQSGNAPSDQA